MSFLINSYAYATGGGADVIPDALNASYNATNNYYFGEHYNGFFRINGISTPITLKLTYGTAQVYYKVVNTNPVNVEEFEDPTTWTSIANNGTFSVSNGQWVLFGADSGGGIVEFSGDVLNNSNSDSFLTTINFVISYQP